MSKSDIFDNDFLGGMFGSSGRAEQAKENLRDAAVMAGVREVVNKHSETLRQFVRKIRTLEERIAALEKQENKDGRRTDDLLRET